MSLKFGTAGTTLVVVIEGELDHHFASEARAKIDKYFERSRCRDMVIDMSRVSFMDSSGIGLLIGRYKLAGLKGGRLFAADMNADISRIFEISGLRKLISTGRLKELVKGEISYAK